MSGGANDLNVIEPAAHGAVVLGEAPNERLVTVRALRVGQLPAFARAVGPIAEDITRIMRGDVSAVSIASIIAERTDDVVAAASTATGVDPDVIREATVEQMLELVLAILQANRDFLRGRLLSAIKSAATLSRGDGPTPSTP